MGMQQVRFAGSLCPEKAASYADGNGGLLHSATFCYIAGLRCVAPLKLRVVKERLAFLGANAQFAIYVRPAMRVRTITSSATSRPAACLSARAWWTAA